MDLIKVIVKQSTLDLVVKIVDTRFCKPSEFENKVTKDLITDPSWHWHPFYKQTLDHLPSDYEAYTVHCTKLRTLTKIRRPYRTSLVDEDAPFMILNELQIRNYMKYLGGTIYDNEGYIVWLSDDDDLIIERVFPRKEYTAFYPLTIKGNKYIDYTKFLSFNVIGGK
jgi:hypothetical protein